MFLEGCKAVIRRLRIWRAGKKNRTEVRCFKLEIIKEIKPERLICEVLKLNHILIVYPTLNCRQCPQPISINRLDCYLFDYKRNLSA